MRVDSINNSTAFTSKKADKKENDTAKAEKKAQAQASRKRYFEYLSKQEAVDSLKLSTGREEEDGKFKLGQAVTGLASFAAATTSIVKASNAASQIRELAVKGAEATKDEAAKAVKAIKGAKAFAIGALALGMASITIKRVNQARADKTANSRDFMNDQQRFSIKGATNVYDAVEHEYDRHVK